MKTLTRRPADPADDWRRTWQARPRPADSFPAGAIEGNLPAAKSVNCIETAAGPEAQPWASEEMAGRVAFASRYAAARSAWSRERARGLAQPVYAYAYAFRGGDASHRKGHPALLGAGSRR